MTGETTTIYDSKDNPDTLEFSSDDPTKPHYTTFTLCALG